jgi:Holliday junction resolvasome RuvABC endonuclease subunit
MLGFKGNAKKEVIQKEFIERLDISIKDNDIIDAMILSITGILNKDNNEKI